MQNKVDNYYKDLIDITEYRSNMDYVGSNEIKYTCNSDISIVNNDREKGNSGNKQDNINKNNIVSKSNAIIENSNSNSDQNQKSISILNKQRILSTTQKPNHLSDMNIINTSRLEDKVINKFSELTIENINSIFVIGNSNTNNPHKTNIETNINEITEEENSKQDKLKITSNKLSEFKSRINYFEEEDY